ARARHLRPDLRAKGDVMKLVVAIGGASGAPYAKRMLDFLARHASTDEKTRVEVDLIFTDTGKLVWKQEIGEEPRYPFKTWKNRDFTAPFASGSSMYDAMAVVPCSAGGMARIAH